MVWWGNLEDIDVPYTKKKKKVNEVDGTSSQTLASETTNPWNSISNISFCASVSSTLYGACSGSPSLEGHIADNALSQFFLKIRIFCGL